MSVASRLDTDSEEGKMRYQAFTGLRWLAAIVMAVALAGVLGASASAQTTSSSCQSQVSSQTEITINGETVVDEQFSTVSNECDSPETITEAQTSSASVVAESDSGDGSEADAARATDQSVIPDVFSDEELVALISLLIEVILAEVGI